MSGLIWNRCAGVSDAVYHGCHELCNLLLLSPWQSSSHSNYRNLLGRGFWPHRLPSLCFSLPGISVSSPKLGALFSALSVIIEVCRHLSEHTVVKMTSRSSPDISNPLDIALRLQQVAVKLHRFAVLAFLYSLIKLRISLILRRRCEKVSSKHCLLRNLSVEKLKFNVQYSGMNYWRSLWDFSIVKLPLFFRKFHLNTLKFSVCGLYDARSITTLPNEVANQLDDVKDVSHSHRTNKRHAEKSSLFQQNERRILQCLHTSQVGFHTYLNCSFDTYLSNQDRESKLRG